METTQPDPLLANADILVQAAQFGVGEGMTIILAERFPNLGQVDVESLNFFLIIASVFVAVSRLNVLGLEATRKKQLMLVVFERLDKWKPDGLRGFNDCDQFFDKIFTRLIKEGHKPDFAIPATIGKWIFMNVFARPPKEEECALVDVLGKFVTHSFFDWFAAPLKNQNSPTGGKN